MKFTTYYDIKYLYNMLAALAFFIPVYPAILPVLIAIIIVLWLVNLIGKKVQFSLTKSFWLIVGLYIFYILGMLYTSNLHYGWKDLETKLSLLIFPLLFSTVNLTRANLEKILKYFVAGCFLAMSYNIVESAYHFYIDYRQNNILNFSHFYYFNLSSVVHPSYLALYLCLAVSIILYWIQFRLRKINIHLLYVSLLSLVLFIFMLSSKAGILTLSVVLIYHTYTFFKSRLNVQKFIIPITVALLIISLYLYFVPGATTRLELNPELITGDKIIESDTDDSSEIRILLWKSSWDIIKQNWFWGVGTGDVKDELMNVYSRESIKWAEQFKLNAHNQLMQTWIAIGIPGLLLLFPWILMSIIKGNRNNFDPQIILGVIVFINLLFESMLETQAGVIFIAFFTSLFIFIIPENNTIANNH